MSLSPIKVSVENKEATMIADLPTEDKMTGLWRIT